MASSNFLVLVTMNGCGACEQLKRAGALAKYSNICKERGDVVFVHQELADPDDGKDRYPAFTLDPIAWYPTVMLVTAPGARTWGKHLQYDRNTVVRVLGGTWNGPHSSITQSGQRVDRSPDGIKSWLDRELGESPRGSQAVIQSAFNVRTAGEMSPQRPQYNAYGGRSMLFTPAPQGRTSSLGTASRYSYGYY